MLFTVCIRFIWCFKRHIGMHCLDDVMSKLCGVAFSL